MHIRNHDGDMTTDGLRFLTSESQPMDRHCRCGAVVLDPFAIACEHCEVRFVAHPLERTGEDA